MNFALKDLTFKELRDYIYDKSGIYIPDTKRYFIENRLLKRIQDKKLEGFDEYLCFLKNNPCREEMAKLFDAITTNETYFFREQHQLDVFMNTVVPMVSKLKRSKHIRVWSAACSTGEEPYTISMMLAEAGIMSPQELIGSDISDGVLASAKRAVYSSYSIRNVPESYLRKYFICNGQVSYEVKNEIKGSVNFANINLVKDGEVKRIRSMDVIFCRNVLIYFDDKSKQKAISNIYDSLVPGGYLFVGSSESLHNITRAFKPVIINKVVIYQKV